MGVLVALALAGCSSEPDMEGPPAGPVAGLAGAPTAGTPAAGAAAASGAPVSGVGGVAGTGAGAGGGAAAGGQGGATSPGPDAGTIVPTPDAGVQPSQDAGQLADGFYRMERLDRGVVAVSTAGGVFVSFRMFGYEHDPDRPEAVSFEVLRDGVSIATLTTGTSYLDPGGTSGSRYAVRAVVDGAPGELSDEVSVWAESYLRIPLERPPSGRTPGAPTCETPNESYSYHANDATAADLDGDGAYELVLKWDPSNSKDNSQSGCTGPVLIDAYELDGTHLWRLDLGPNIRAGAHYTQMLAYDLDGDGKAELALKTAEGTRDGTGEPLKLGPAASDDDQADYRSIANAGGRTGYVLTGPEYLTVFDGETGAERATVAFEVARGSVRAWGDDYGNRVDRFLATVAYLDETGLPSLVMARGYYTRTTLTAWTFRDGVLGRQWTFDSDETPLDDDGNPFMGQGAHSLSVADVDDDPQQEILYGAMAVDHDGRGLCSTGYGHGDALHVGDLAPSHPGIEVFMCNEDGAHPAYHLRDARTCEVLQAGPINGADTGRCVAGDVFDGNDGAEMWASGVDGMFAAETNARVGNKPGSQNFLIWWDGDETRELEDGTSITKYGAGRSLVSCGECASNNGTKSTPALSADLIGDWREEVLWREADDSALRLYTTTAVSSRRIYTLMHDPQYRVAIAWQNVAYNQPPHPSFHIGAGMREPPRPDIRVR